MIGQSEYQGEAIDDVIYAWSLEPETAGTLTSDGHHVLVEWDSDYRGQASSSYRYENPCGSTAISEALDINLFNSTGVNENNVPSIEVYPNPAKDLIQVKTHLEGEVLLRVIDLTGKVVFECRMQNEEYRIDTTKFGGGIYTLQAIHNGNVSNVRIVVIP